MPTSDTQIGATSLVIYALQDAIRDRRRSRDYWQERNRPGIAACMGTEIEQYRKLLADIRADKVQVTRTN